MNMRTLLTFGPFCLLFRAHLPVCRAYFAQNLKKGRGTQNVARVVANIAWMRKNLLNSRAYSHVSFACPDRIHM